MVSNFLYSSDFVGNNQLMYFHGLILKKSNHSKSEYGNKKHTLKLFLC